MTMLHIFDLDGTLIKGTSASMEISRHLNIIDEFLDLELRFSAGGMTTQEFAQKAFASWASLDASVVTTAFDGAPWMQGIRETFADIRSRGEKSLVITMSPDFFAERLLSFGVDSVSASTFPKFPFSGDLTVNGILKPEDKVVIADKALSELGIARTRCVAYGDSISDIPLFEALAYTTAINADAKLERIATAAYRGDCIFDAYEMSRKMILS